MFAVHMLIIIPFQIGTIQGWFNFENVKVSFLKQNMKYEIRYVCFYPLSCHSLKNVNISRNI